MAEKKQKEDKAKEVKKVEEVKQKVNVTKEISKNEEEKATEFTSGLVPEIWKNESVELFEVSGNEGEEVVLGGIPAGRRAEDAGVAAGTSGDEERERTPRALYDRPAGEEETGRRTYTAPAMLGTQTVREPGAGGDFSPNIVRANLLRNQEVGRVQGITTGEETIQRYYEAEEGGEKRRARHVWE
ncbi:hypothetical protein HYV50_00495 [Candidatus Pacearchaeota archaeon]|nr:hypothetical protein [Candidatus Pacearchaeota archaeon]